MAEDMHELCVDYVMDDLDEFRRARFERHLDECESCQLEVADLRSTTDELGELAWVNPPVSLRDRVLTEIATTAQVEPLALAESASDLSVTAEANLSSDNATDATVGHLELRPPTATGSTGSTGSTGPTGSADEADEAHEADEATVVELRRTPRMVWLALAAAVAAVLVGVAWQPWQSELSKLSEQVLEASDAQSFVSTSNGATYTIVRSASVGEALMWVDGLPAPDADHTYQVWVQGTDEVMVSSALIDNPESDDPIVLEGPVADAVAAGVTVEPLGGSPEPTTEPLAFFPLA